MVARKREREVRVGAAKELEGGGPGATGRCALEVTEERPPLIWGSDTWVAGGKGQLMGAVGGGERIGFRRGQARGDGIPTYRCSLAPKQGGEYRGVAAWLAPGPRAGMAPCGPLPACPQAVWAVLPRGLAWGFVPCTMDEGLRALGWMQ